MVKMRVDVVVAVIALAVRVASRLELPEFKSCAVFKIHLLFVKA